MKLFRIFATFFILIQTISASPVQKNVDFVGSRLRNKFPFDLKPGTKQTRKVRRNHVDKSNSVFKKLSDYLVDKFDIPVFVEAIEKVAPKEEDTFTG